MLTDRATLPLWPQGAPGARGHAPEDTPAVQVFLPPQPTGASIVVFPGGSYSHLADHEGPAVGAFFAGHGLTAFVVRYRLGPVYHHPTQFTDAQRAIRLVRHHAAERRLDPDRVAIIGFSAGGHLASTLATHFAGPDFSVGDTIDRPSDRPDLQILIYPVISMGPEGHAGSRQHLLGNDPAPELLAQLSNHRRVSADTPPAFLVHSTEDTAVPVANSDLYAEALRACKVPCEYLRGPYGGHGFGLKPFWTDPCISWLAARRFARA